MSRNMLVIEENLRRLLLSLGFKVGDKLPTASQLNNRLTAAYERGRSEQRAADEPVIEAAKAWKAAGGAGQSSHLWSPTIAEGDLEDAVDQLLRAEGPETP